MAGSIICLIIGFIIFSIILILFTVWIVWFVIRKFSSKRKNTSGATFMSPSNMGLRGKTAEQKTVIKYFNSTGILGMIFRISDSTFDNLLDGKAQEIASQIVNRALAAHGVDADEVKEIQPILVEDYYGGSDYFKFFRDYTFRASGYQMTYLMFSDKQIYAYSYIFDLTSANTITHVEEYAYEDITSVETTQRQVEFPAPRPLEFLVGGVAGIIIGILMMTLSDGNGALVLFGSVILLIGLIVAIFLGYSRRLVNILVLKLTVANNSFECSMKPESLAAVQGMKAKIREKKR